ncbi:MAG: AAA family ATPase [Candidatus Pacebacteria bacterium]|nr:AAA family ATPase [Candidatus Paceibacterota bacterium]
MTLKSIELSSFKSFGKKSVVNFTTPVTAIVGPNGSGKSNIVEAIRFVLGEQSMKSLRGKGGVDLIFKGSKSMSQANRASVTITFDNKDKIFSFTNSGLGVSLDYDEVTVTREVYADGANKYLINGTEVRLKDINDLLASVNIGSSGHHIISQGEADRVLNANSRDRRGMIEDALGLKVYQFRIKETERKLDKTVLNMKEVSAMRREVVPHLNFLKKQVEKLERAREMREELGSLYKDYLSKESAYIKHETARLHHKRRIIDENLLSLDERIESINKNKDTKESVLNFKEALNQKELYMSGLRARKDELSRKLGRVEGSIDSIMRGINRAPEIKEDTISKEAWQSFADDLESCIDEANRTEVISELKDIFSRIKNRLGSIRVTSNKDEVNNAKEELKREYLELESVREGIVTDIELITKEEEDVLVSIGIIRAEEKEFENENRDSEKVVYELLSQKNVLNSDLHSISFEEEKLAQIKNAFDFEMNEAGALVGREVLGFNNIEVDGANIIRTSQDESRRKIERIKIKLEDAGALGGGDLLKEYEDTKERDIFLEKELNDLQKSIESLRTLIVDLKETLDTEFKQGVEKINKQFQDFFSLMFGGGSAFLSVTMEHKKSRKKDELEEVSEDSEDDNELGFERGIEINVTLPQKKVKDLHMLSGGERSLTSIALLFAISQVNPPPFLVLDETDAALDEANSRKYGNMIENLSSCSQLIVVTHNRETMSRAQVLYGVTMDIMGASKLLSIKLDDATVYAK